MNDKKTCQSRDSEKIQPKKTLPQRCKIMGKELLQVETKWLRSWKMKKIWPITVFALPTHHFINQANKFLLKRHQGKSLVLVFSFQSNSPCTYMPKGLAKVWIQLQNLRSNENMLRERFHHKDKENMAPVMRYSLYEEFTSPFDALPGRKQL